MNIVYGSLLSVLIVLIPLLSQATADQGIDTSKFKLVKIKRLGFLFRGMGIPPDSVSKDGILLPMLVIQIQGYILGILTLLFVIFNEILHFIDKTSFFAISVLILHLLIVFFTLIVTECVSKRRCGKKIYQDGIVIYTGTNNYLVIAKEKGLITHYCVDKNLTRAYVIKSQSIEKDIFDFIRSAHPRASAPSTSHPI